MSRGILARNLQRWRGAIEGQHADGRTFRCNGDGNATAARAEIQSSCKRGVEAREELPRAFREQFRLRPRYEHVPVHSEFQSAKMRGAENLLQRLPQSATTHHVAH